MVHRDDESEITQGQPKGAGAGKPRRGIIWILAAFGVLIAGLAGGTILFAWRSAWAGVVPLAAFLGYILAFRRGLLLWNPNIDRTWRVYLWLDRNTASQEGPATNGADDSSGGANNLRIVRPGSPHPARHELRVVR